MNSHQPVSLALGRSVNNPNATNSVECQLLQPAGQSPNYDRESVNMAARMLESAGCSPRLMVDFSHANSGKQHRGQITVGADVSRQLAEGENRVVGVMIESNIVEGRQDVVAGSNLVYGQSITDACLGWDDTVEVIDQLATAVGTRRSLSR